jgi:copper chaperone
MASVQNRYLVDGIHCDHCGHAIRSEVIKVPGVADVTVDIEGKEVTVRGDAVDEAAVRAAIREAGYEAAA